MATKLQNLEAVERIAKECNALVVVDREQGTGQWTVRLEWSNGGYEAKCWGRGKSLEAALADVVSKAGHVGIPTG